MKDTDFFAGCIIWVVLLVLAGLGWIAWTAAHGDADSQRFLLVPVYFVLFFVLPSAAIGYGIARLNRKKGSSK